MSSLNIFLRFAGFALIVLTVLSGATRPAAARDAEWTFLLYLAADNNLEASTLADLREMIAVGGSDQVKIIALVDRSEKHDPAMGY